MEFISPTNRKLYLQQSLSITSTRRLSPVEFISSTSKDSIPNKGSLSPAIVIHPQPRLFLQISRSSSKVSLPHRIILSLVYSPTELFSRQFILQQSYSPINVFSNHLRPSSPVETKNSNPCTLQQQYGIYFPQLEDIINNIYIHTS